MTNRKLTGRRFHRYINPERQVEAGALAVHGLSDEFLQDKPKFRDIAGDFVDFIRGAELVIHNAPFDVGFLNHEMSLLGLSPLDGVVEGVVDSLRMAKDLHPGRRNSLDALCERYQVNHSQRTLHGALLDAELLGEVYLAMTRGQESLIIDLDQGGGTEDVHPVGGERPALRVVRATAGELADHERLLDEIARESKGRCVWRLETAADR
jgi:DNA polymerase-3 subunit epsilon